MNFYLNNSFTDPYLNMAVEEFLFQNYNESVFHLWQNEASVIVGKNQLLEAEIDLDYVQKQNIKIVRRFTGGGAVYQDLGNVNLSFIDSNANLNFDMYNQRIMDFLSSLGLNPTTNERRAIFIDGKKVSGCSQHIRGNKIIYHATLLFSSELSHLENSLRGNDKIELSSKFVKSVKSPVTNLSNYFQKNYNIQNFKADILNFFTENSSKNIILSAKELEKIHLLKTAKYLKEEWIRSISIN